MNGIERITRRIESDTQGEIDRILADAKAEAGSIAEGWKSRAEAESRDLAARGAKAAAEREERLVSMAQMEARKVLLAAKQEMVEKAYALALDKLTSLPQKEYVDALAALIAEASSTGTEEVLFNPADRKKVGKDAVAKANASGKKLTLSADTVDIRGGFILRDRNIEVNCAFETLVRLQKAETSAAVVQKLFPEGA